MLCMTASVLQAEVTTKAEETGLQVSVWWLLVAVAGAALILVACLHRQRLGLEGHIRKSRVRAAAAERRRIAREFHDSLQQQLASAALHLETLQGALLAAPEMVPRLIDDTTAMIRHCQTEARLCIWDLHGDWPTSVDLAEALACWVEMRAAETSGTRVTFHSRGELPVLAEGVPFQIMRIAQEAVNNALAHARPAHLTVTLGSTAGIVELRVEDDGCGFALRSPRQPHGHYGLTSQRERAKKIGAQLELLSAPGQGTRLTLRVPATQPVHDPAL